MVDRMQVISYTVALNRKVDDVGPQTQVADYFLKNEIAASELFKATAAPVGASLRARTVNHLFWQEYEQCGECRSWLSHSTIAYAPLTTQKSRLPLHPSFFKPCRYHAASPLPIAVTMRPCGTSYTVSATVYARFESAAAQLLATGGTPIPDNATAAVAVFNIIAGNGADELSTDSFGGNVAQIVPNITDYYTRVRAAVPRGLIDDFQNSLVYEPGVSPPLLRVNMCKLTYDNRSDWQRLSSGCGFKCQYRIAYRYPASLLAQRYVDYDGVAQVGLYKQSRTTQLQCGGSEMGQPSVTFDAAPRSSSVPDAALIKNRSSATGSIEFIRGPSLMTAFVFRTEQIMNVVINNTKETPSIFTVIANTVAMVGTFYTALLLVKVLIDSCFKDADMCCCDCGNRLCRSNDSISRRPLANADHREAMDKIEAVKNEDDKGAREKKDVYHRIRMFLCCGVSFKPPGGHIPPPVAETLHADIWELKRLQDELNQLRAHLKLRLEDYNTAKVVKKALAGNKLEVADFRPSPTKLPSFVSSREAAPDSNDSDPGSGTPLESGRGRNCIPQSLVPLVTTGAHLAASASTMGSASDDAPVLRTNPMRVGAAKLVSLDSVIAED